MLAPPDPGHGRLLLRLRFIAATRALPQRTCGLGLCAGGLLQFLPRGVGFPGAAVLGAVVRLGLADHVAVLLVEEATVFVGVVFLLELVKLLVGWLFGYEPVLQRFWDVFFCEHVEPGLALLFVFILEQGLLSLDLFKLLSPEIFQLF